jgi:hypothetical protein
MAALHTKHYVHRTGGSYKGSLIIRLQMTSAIVCCKKTCQPATAFPFETSIRIGGVHK